MFANLAGVLQQQFREGVGRPAWRRHCGPPPVVGLV
jgi:hypothetical protein